MKDSNQEYEWSDLKEMWLESSEGKKIHIELTKLIEELNSKTTDFEKNTIKSDIAVLRRHWEPFEAQISQFEKNSIQKDLRLIKNLLAKFLSWIKKDK